MIQRGLYGWFSRRDKNAIRYDRTMTNSPFRSLRKYPILAERIVGRFSLKQHTLCVVHHYWPTNYYISLVFSLVFQYNMRVRVPAKRYYDVFRATLYYDV